ncbi:hypothetical protein RJ639_001219 [Escallonia herrerae]|uniref:RanBP2-type domain-containing protein n=1 Tax=Escallonia herrerae TaxID=1293975 RepID=A0AA88XB69_9ASTE|nr:hypothetical protein RJ639_001219 [Escallonia herrerae]
MLKLLATRNGHHLQKSKPQFHLAISHVHGRSSKAPITNPAIEFILNEVQELQSSKDPTANTAQNARPLDPTHPMELPTAQISHPWPEWVGLMEQLLKAGYFEETANGNGNPFRNGEIGSKDMNQIRTACLNFARDRSDLMRCFSRKDIEVVAGSGCPSVDRKVVNSGKRLRAHVGIEERHVCSSCILRGNCGRAYMKACKDGAGRTVDVMRFLLPYGLDYITNSVENKPGLNKAVKESVRRLLKEMVGFSMQDIDCDTTKVIPPTLNSSSQSNSTYQGDSQINVPVKQDNWICPKCDFINSARNFKCLRCDVIFQQRFHKQGEDQDHLPLKKGDWICDKYYTPYQFQCKENPPKRHLNPGEWECDSCNYINFRRNMVCLKCDHKRPKASNSTGPPVQSGHNHYKPHAVDMHRFVEEEKEDRDGSNLWNEVPGMLDFPIVGGKSSLSRNARMQERWKIDMTEKKKNFTTARNNADDFEPAMTWRSSDVLESTSDEEMAEWFGHEKSR